jgi:hypothetical protein
LHFKDSNQVFQAAVNDSDHAFIAVADSGCSETCSPHLTGIAGSLPVTHAGRVHWETVDDFGELIEFETEAFYHPATPGRLFSPQSYLRREQRGKATELAIQGEASIWRVNMKYQFTVRYSKSFLPRITLFHAGKAVPTLMALQSVIQHENMNMSPLQKIWMRWHIRLGHLSFSHVKKLGLGGFLERHGSGKKP